MIESVDRADDPRIAIYAHVADPDWLRAAGLFVAEGRLVVQRLVESGRFAVESVLVTPAALDSLTELLPSLQRTPVYVCPQGTLESLSGFNFHRGCLAIARRPAEDTPLETLARAERLLAMEGVGNPDNVGGLFRVAAAFGVGGVLLDPASADPLYRKAVRTSMAASLRVPFHRAQAWPEALHSLRGRGFEIVAATPQPAAQDIEGFAPRARARVVVLVGAESAGLSDAALAAADHRVRIAIDPRSDSLNVTVAAGILLHRLNRTRQENGRKGESLFF